MPFTQGRDHLTRIQPGIRKRQKADKNFKTIRERKVCYQDEKNRYYEFLTNNFEISAKEVAFLYKKRWGIELIIKQLTRNFPLKYFLGDNENPIEIQIWTAYF